MPENNRPPMLRTDANYLERLMRSRPGHVLVVEDDAGQRTILTRILNRMGLVVTQAVNGKEALDFLRGKEEECDAILLDLLMPVMDGARTLQEIRALPEGIGIPVIILTVVDDIQNVIEYLHRGASDYLCKPYSPDELLARVEAHIRVRQLQRVIREVVSQNVQNVIAASMADTLHNRLLTLTGYLSLQQANFQEAFQPTNPAGGKNRSLQEKVDESLSSLHSAIDELVDYTRGTANCLLEQVELESLFMELTGEYRDYLAISLIGVNSGLIMAGSFGKLQSCFRELICNALEAGATTLEIRCAREPDNQLRIDFSDNGAGIDRKLAEVATLPFFTTKGSLHTGLVGLWSSRQYLASIGGDLALTGNPGQGVTVTMHIPLFSGD